MKHFCLSDIGKVRAKNQDSYLVVTNKVSDVLVLVCDGIGGNKAGEVASYEIVKYFSDIFKDHEGFKDSTDLITYVKYHVRSASNLVYELSLKNFNYEGMGTTITGILMSSVGNFVINAGDSRVYNIYNHKLTQLTVDHTYVNDLLKYNMITKEEALNHPKRHHLTKFLGIYEDASVDVKKVSSYSDYYLVCSDGLHGYVAGEDLLAVIDSEGSLKEKAYRLLDKALAKGGYDNITMVLIDNRENDNYE